MLTLSQTYLQQLFRYEKRTGHIYWRVNKSPARRIGDRAGRTNTANGYRFVKIDGQEYREHRVIWALVTGEWPPNIDHKDRNRARNVWTNLRKANDSLNGSNKLTAGCSGTRYRGIKRFQTSANRVRWQARICVQKNDIHLGMYETAESAAKAYDNAARKYFGKFARPNF